MAPQYVSEIKDRWPAGRAGIEHCPYRLEITIQIDGRGYVSAQFQEVFAGVPPGVDDPGGKYCAPSGRYLDLIFSDAGSESSSFHGESFRFQEMNVQRRATGVWRQTAVDGQNNFAGGVADPAEAENFSSVAEFQLQNVVQRLPPESRRSSEDKCDLGGLILWMVHSRVNEKPRDA